MIIVEKEIQELIGAEYNPRQLTSQQHKHLKDSLKRFGIVDPVIININPERKNVIVGGHMRTRIWEELGNKTIPCVEVDLTPEKEKELNVRLNKNTGEWDHDILANYFEQEDLIEWGFNDLAKYNTEPIEDVWEDEKKPSPTITVVFEGSEQVQKAQNEIQELIDRKYSGAYLTVKGLG